MAQAMTTQKKIGNLAAFLDSRKAEIVKVLPDGVPVDRVIKTAVMAAMENPKIGDECTPLSIYRSVMQASVMGLTVGSGYNEGYFIQYKDNCTFRASYLGWVKVAVRTPGIDMVRASVVYAMDKFSVSEHPPSVHHEISITDRGDPIGAVACAYSINDGTHRLYDFCFVPMCDLKQAQDLANRFKESPAWKAWPDEMMKKVAIRRLCKLLPRNDDMNKLTQIENNADNGNIVPDPDVLPDTDSMTGEIVDCSFAEDTEIEAPKSRTTNLKQRMTKKEEPDYGDSRE